MGRLFRKKDKEEYEYNKEYEEAYEDVINKRYIRDLDRQFNQRFDEQYDDDFELGTKYKVLAGIGTAAIIIVLLVVMLIIVPTIGNKNNSNVNNGQMVKDAHIEDEPIPLATADPHEGMVKNRFTGTWIKEEIADNRPYAIMFNNIKAASPQSGTSDADIMYEAVVEGGITRLMGIFTTLPTTKIGSIRSARPYYVSIAKEYDAVYIHVGGSDDAKSKVGALSVADLDGTSFIGNTLIYREPSARAPHNAFTTVERISKATKTKGYRMDYQGKEDNHFAFNDKMLDLKNSNICNNLTICFSSYTSPSFIYDSKKKVYNRFQFGSSHIDKNNNKQLAYTNIIIQYVNEWTIDNAGRQAMDIYNSSGDGVYISGGKYKNITWSRNEERCSMQYKDEGGKLLKVNPGKTYIALVPRDNRNKTVIK
ncbi:MAG: DUF3048 domain-containing protein [Lachnospiraceae bacterium]|nr:DUF3048 domain-containing protein [Lachnospiraceae bacterium]